MTRPIVGVAVSNGRFQDELCDALAPHLQVERCRTDRELLALVAQHAIAGAVVGQELLGLDRHVLPALVRCGTPTVLLAAERDVPRRQERAAGSPVRVLSLGATPEMIVTALDELSGARPRIERAGAHLVEVRPPAAAASARKGRLYAFVGSGGTGCTTIVANLLVAVGAARPVIGIDLDPVAPLLVPLLDGDPSLGLNGVMRAQEAGVASLERALEANLQAIPQAQRAPHARILGGLPLNGDRRLAPPADLIEAVLSLLSERDGVVLADVGRLLPAGDRLAALQRAALLAADGVLVVSGGDRPSVLRTCDAVAHLLGAAPHLGSERLALVLNRYHGATMDPPPDIAASIGLPLVACAPADEPAMRRGVQGHQPVVLQGRGPSARELLGLADALSAGNWPPHVGTRGSLRARLLERGRGYLAALRPRPWWARRRRAEARPVLSGVERPRKARPTRGPRRAGAFGQGARVPLDPDLGAAVGAAAAAGRTNGTAAGSHEGSA